MVHRLRMSIAGSRPAPTDGTSFYHQGCPTAESPLREPPNSVKCLLWRDCHLYGPMGKGPGQGTYEAGRVPAPQKFPEISHDPDRRTPRPIARRPDHPHIPRPFGPGEADCKTLAWLYLCEPGYVRWDGSARLVCTMYQLLSDPQAVGRRRRPLASVSARIKWGPYDRSRGDRATNTGGGVEVGVAREEPVV